MNDSLWIALISVLPVAALFAGAPRRPRRALAAGAAALAAWGVGMFTVLGPLPGLALGAWAAAVGGYAFWMTGRAAEQESRLSARVLERQVVREGLTQRLKTLKEETQRWEDEQRKSLAVYGLVKGLAEVLNWEAVRPRLEAAVEQHLRFEEYAFFVPDARSGSMYPLLRKRLNRGIGSSWESLERYWRQSGRDRAAPFQVEESGRIVAVPIVHSQEMVGFLVARVPKEAGADDALERAREFGEEIAFALRRVRLFQEVEELSEIDGLTGVYRRHRLDERLQEESARARAFKTGYCVMMIDIDHFKRLNDTYGHIFGDIVLKRMGDLLKSSVYETDFVARYGGEEFAILLPRADVEGVMRRAEAIRARVAAETFTQAMETVRVTVSIGIAHMPRDGQLPEEIIRRADQALYAAKIRGRDRVVDIVKA